jgi:hypothetical protein
VHVNGVKKKKNSGCCSQGSSSNLRSRFMQGVEPGPQLMFGSAI